MNKKILRIIGLAILAIAVAFLWYALSQPGGNFPWRNTAFETEADPKTTQNVQIANPWQTFENLKSAEQYAGIELGIPETVADTYKAVSYSVLNGDKILLQVGYQYEEFEVEIRKSQGEGQDVSGVYGFENTDTTERNGVIVRMHRPSDKSEVPNAVLITFDYHGFSWSLYAENGFWGDSCDDFLSAVFS